MPTQSFRLSDVLDAVMHTEPWTRRWLSPLPGMVVCATAERTFEARNLNIPMPPQLQALGCGGWDRSGMVHWVGIDLDIGHGTQSYASLTAAICAAMCARQLVKGAAEIRLSKSGQGVHIRVALAKGVSGRRPVSACIAKWLARELDLKADASPLGRQNFWFWVRQPKPNGFALIAPSTTLWTPPPEAYQTPVSAQPVIIRPSMSPPSEPRQRLSWKTRDFLQHGAPVGQRNYRLFIAACDFSGAGIPEDQATSELTSVAESIGMAKAEAHATIHSAYSKPRLPANHNYFTTKGLTHRFYPHCGRLETQPLGRDLFGAVRIEPVELNR